MEDNNQEISQNNKDLIRCPQCGSTNIHFVTKTSGGGFNGAKGCLGGLVCLPGALLGFEKKKSETVRKCMNCGKEF